MCPFCLATVGVVLAGVCTYGLTTLAGKVSREKHDAANAIPDGNQSAKGSAKAKGKAS
jgi:hypothetical protein